MVVFEHERLITSDAKSPPDSYCSHLLQKTPIVVQAGRPPQSSSEFCGRLSSVPCSSTLWMVPPPLSSKPALVGLRTDELPQ
mmetsp:Transcript_4051/g.16253  ORF Transcript_4051/g.16253 Transcript_4051/m.16253 type:complete len:82 (+) Transcript_4051:3816-4061(+)